MSHQKLERPPSEEERLEKLLALEVALRQRGFQSIAGVDEAGRGPLAGPLIAAACSIGAGICFPGINDSKLLTPKKRYALFKEITSHSGVRYGVGRASVECIDKINIHQATMQAMREAIGHLGFSPDYVIVDGFLIPGLPNCMKVLQGDQKCHAIAAASIIAKCTRDEEMQVLHQQYPHYHFDTNQGYGTAKHLKALSSYGPSPIHRRTFAPVAALQGVK